MQVIVDSPDEGLYVLMFLHPTKGTWIKSETITSGCDADSFKTAIKGYYKEIYDTEPTVALTYYTSEIIETVEGANDVAVLIYTIEVPTAISQPSVENIMLIPMTTSSDIEFVYSVDLQLSSPPLTGSFWLKCYDTEGNWYSTQDISIGSNANWIRSILQADCPFL